MQTNAPHPSPSALWSQSSDLDRLRCPLPIPIKTNDGYYRAACFLSWSSSGQACGRPHGPAQGVLHPALSDGAEGGRGRGGRQDGCGGTEGNSVECGGRADLLEHWLKRKSAAEESATAGGEAWGTFGGTKRLADRLCRAEWGKPAQSPQSDANIVPQAPQPPPGWGASEPAFSSRDAQFCGNCHRTWRKVSSQCRDHSLSPFTEGQLPLAWLVSNTVKSQRGGS